MHPPKVLTKGDEIGESIMSVYLKVVKVTHGESWSTHEVNSVSCPSRLNLVFSISKSWHYKICDKPDARRSDPIEQAWPTQYVCMGEDTYWGFRCTFTPIDQFADTSARSNDFKPASSMSLRQDWGRSRKFGTDCIIYCHASGNTSSRRINIEVNGFGCIFRFKKE